MKQYIYLLEIIMSEQAILYPVEKETSAVESLEKARIYHEKYLIKQQDKDLENAISLYIDTIKLDPAIPEAYYRLASLLFEKGQITVYGAIEQCRTALTLSPDNANAHIYTGYFLGVSGDYAAAAEEFKIAIKKSGLNSARPRLFLSKMIMEQIRNKEKNVAAMAQSLYYFLSGSMMIMWDYPTLKMLYKYLADDFSVMSFKTLGSTCEKIKMLPSAFDIYSKGVEKTEHGDVFYQKMGDLALDSDDMITCLECYRKALETSPDNRDIMIKLATIIQTYFPEEIDEAIDYYNRLLEFGIDNDKIYYELGHLYLKKEDRLHSATAFKLAVDMEPENPYYNNSLAYAYIKCELYDEAIECYQKAIKINPDSKWTAIVCHALGAIYGEIHGNFEAAEATFQAAMALDPENIDVQLSLGDLYMAKGDIDGAIKTYCDTIAIDGASYLSYSKVGLALWEKDYLEESLVAFHKSIDINPEFDIAQNNIGVVYLDGFGDSKTALEYFKTACELNPNYTLAYFNAGRASQALGNKTAAAEYYQHAMNLNKLTNELEEKDIRERLYELFD